MMDKADHLHGEQTEVDFKQRYKRRLGVFSVYFAIRMGRVGVVMYGSGMMERQT